MRQQTFGRTTDMNRIYEETVALVNDLDQRVQILKHGISQTFPYLAAPGQLSPGTSAAWVPAYPASGSFGTLGSSPMGPSHWSELSRESAPFYTLPGSTVGSVRYVPVASQAPAAPALASAWAFEGRFAVPSYPTQTPDCRVPLVDVYDEADAYRVVWEIPGATKENLECGPGPYAGTLSVRVRQGNEQEPRQALFLERGLRTGPFRFERIFHVAPDADVNRCKPELENGLLTIWVPRRAAGTARSK